jgi:hypothetical protein
MVGLDASIELAGITAIVFIANILLLYYMVKLYYKALKSVNKFGKQRKKHKNREKKVG